MQIPQLVVQGKTVFIGLSGGVDSSVAAAILRDNGAKVVGVYMKNWAGEQGLQLDCPWEEEQASAQAAAAHLGIEFRSYNFEREYKTKVLDYFFAEYNAGRTPNPDILCNSEIKFKAFLEKAISEGADLIATGHYAGIETRSLGNFRGEFLIKAVDNNKDQTYFLSGLSQEQLSRAVFPLAKLTKPEVRELAKQYGLPNAERKDSQGICFIGDLDVREFLRKYLAKQEGDIVDIDTKKAVGQHDGVQFYTLGQREGLRVGGTAEPYYVAAKDITTNQLFVAQGKTHPALYKTEVKFSQLTLLNPGLSLIEMNELGLQASVRYRQAPRPGKFSNDSFVFAQPQWAVAPGQSLVFYQQDICLGRAVIENN